MVLFKKLKNLKIKNVSCKNIEKIKIFFQRNAI